MALPGAPCAWPKACRSALVSANCARQARDARGLAGPCCGGELGSRACLHEREHGVDRARVARTILLAKQPHVTALLAEVRRLRRRRQRQGAGRRAPLLAARHAVRSHPFLVRRDERHCRRPLTSRTFAYAVWQEGQRHCRSLCCSLWHRRSLCCRLRHCGRRCWAAPFPGCRSWLRSSALAVAAEIFSPPTAFKVPRQRHRASCALRGGGQTGLGFSGAAQQQFEA